MLSCASGCERHDVARPAIVVGVGSLHPSGPLRTAAEIAAAFGCELIVVHVLRFPTVLAPEAMSVVGAAIAAEEDDERVVHRACTGVLETYGVPWRFEPRLGDVAIELEAVADEYDAVCIVIGRHGRHHLVHALSGSPLHSLVDDSLRPVLVVPTGV
ncbi:MAG: universal stress protein [Ilumatobacteraceae bacterium]|jgi:nucleotide-binding universal stress UspA family protein